jgi:ABC-type bacteriocin/lantibiotic exporter with double-glycine peptidase domain
MTPVLNNVNMHIKSGEQLGIVGPSGRGKSTLLKIILGIHPITQGNLQIQTQNPKEFFQNPQNRIGYIGVDSYLFLGSIKENLLYGNKLDITDAEIVTHMNQFGLQDIVSQGLDFIISDTADNLSAGQKQRLAFVRAILNKPCVLILDEATANLDMANETIIADYLLALKNKCTVIIVSHRSGILVHADKIITL